MGRYDESRSGVVNLRKMADELSVCNAIATKTIYNTALDTFHFSYHCKGFLDKECISTLSTNAENHLGIYCIRWHRSGTNAENELKLLVNSLDSGDSRCPVEYSLLFGGEDLL